MPVLYKEYIQHVHPASPQWDRKGPSGAFQTPALGWSFSHPFPSPPDLLLFYMCPVWIGAGAFGSCRLLHGCGCLPEHNENHIRSGSRGARCFWGKYRSYEKSFSDRVISCLVRFHTRDCRYKMANRVKPPCLSKIKTSIWTPKKCRKQRNLLHHWEITTSNQEKIGCVLWAGGMAYFHAPGNHSNTSHYRHLESSCMWKIVDGTFLQLFCCSVMLNEQEFERLTSYVLRKRMLAPPFPVRNYGMITIMGELASGWDLGWKWEENKNPKKINQFRVSFLVCRSVHKSPKPDNFGLV